MSGLRGQVASLSVCLLSPEYVLPPVEDSRDMDTGPLRPQNYLFGCELKADKDEHLRWIMMNQLPDEGSV